jgi:hypothetical protein
MKTLILAFTLAILTSASAQIGSPWPTVNKVVGPDGKQIGTATEWGKSTTFRKLDGELMGSLTMESPGVLVLRDPSGKIKETATTEGNTVTVRDSAGATIRTTTKEQDGSFTVRDGNGIVIKLPE